MNENVRDDTRLEVGACKSGVTAHVVLREKQSTSTKATAGTDSSPRLKQDHYAATTLIRAAFRERGFRRMMISTS
jgi:hypothetical protein